MHPTCLFWAKLGTDTWPVKYHPVICHLIDVAAVTRELWTAVFRPRFREWMASRLGLTQAECGGWLAFWSGAHDIGKVSPCFQDCGQRTAELRRRLEPDFDFPTHNEPHGVLSTKILDTELTSTTSWPRVERQAACNVAVAVGGHHGFFPTNWDGICAPLGNGSWAAARSEILAQLARLTGVTRLPPPRPGRPDDHSLWLCVAGLTSVADWIGSNQEFFRPVGNPALATGPFDVDSYFQDACSRAAEALEKLGWQGAGDMTGPIPFAELFPHIQTPRPLQTAVVEVVSEMTVPGLLIVEAPMGEGKTEAGWYAAASWNRRGGQGSYVALPTMATSNQMYDRVTEFLRREAGKSNVQLLHGKAALNDRFADLKYAAQVYDDDDTHPSAVVAEGWFAANKKHGLLAPHGVGTIDQALLAVLQTKHVFVRLFGLAGKCVILDEVHAYDAYMTTLMERLLRWLSALGCPMVLLSATLPRAKRLQLLRAYAGEDLGEPADVPYPRLTAVAIGGHAEVRQIQADQARERTVRLGWLDEADLAEKLRQSLAHGGCAAVIRNTVKLAQDTFRVLREALRKDGIEVELFHARFPFGRRKQIEDAVIRRYGRTNRDEVDDQGRIVSAPSRPAKSVLVATQVVEQSLDLDFDLMVSDLAPVDLVLQRAGRLHRHNRGPRPLGVNEPCIWLIQPPTEEGLPAFGSSEYVYARFILLRSHLAFKAVQAVCLPGDLERFIEQVYGHEPLSIPDGWREALDQAETQMRTRQEEQQLDAMEVAIHDPDQAPLEQQSLHLEEDDPEAAPRIQAQTRDADPAVQLIVIYHLGDRDYLDPPGTEPFDESERPNLDRVRRLLMNEVSTAHKGCFAFYSRRPVPRGWRESGMLRHHRVLRVDRDGNSIPPEFGIQVDRILGVVLK